MKNNKGFIATSLILTFFLLFCALLLNTIRNYNFNQNLIDKLDDINFSKNDNNIDKPGNTEWKFSYKGVEQIFTAPCDGTYKLEIWGAQGGTNGDYIGGYGGYSSGETILTENTKIYIYVGGMGDKNQSGFNGGGKSGLDNIPGRYSGSGGGATHIAKEQGLLTTFENKKDKILIVAGGGGGASVASDDVGGSGGGYTGVNGTSKMNDFFIPQGGNQSDAGDAYDDSFKGRFGTGEASNASTYGGGGGGGFYGGSNGYHATGSGGSGYIGNELLTNKVMYCYNCDESSDESTKTIPTTCTNETPTENCSKQGNGYAKITFISTN